jgi:hypothetical protein
MVESLDVAADGEQRNRIEISGRFVEQGLDPAPLLSQTARQREGGAPSVELEAQIAIDASAALLDADGAATVAEVCNGATAEVDRWDTNRDADARDVSVGLQGFTDKIEQTITDLELLADPNSYPIYRAMRRLAWQMQRAAAVATRNAPALIALVTAGSAPLGVILADLYGAAGATTHRDEAISLNDIRDPMLIPAGTRLTLPTPAAVRAQRTRKQGPAFAR